METQQIMQTLTEIFVDVLDIESINLTPQTTANDVDEWDSLTHIQLVVAIEKKFKIKFTSQEIRGWKNVGELVNSIVSKIK